VTRVLPPPVDRARDLVVPALREAVQRLEPGIREVVEYHLGLDEATTGKALRPALALLSAEAVGAMPEVAVDGAVSVELVHNFSLLHDDVMDRDQERHHRPAAWTVFGESRAILAGDALSTLSIEVLVAKPGEERVRAAALVADATARMIAGQSLDLALEGRTDATVAECLEMISGKTAALLSCSSAVGAILGRADAPVVDGLAAFGEHLGIAFQAVDDLLGIWGRPEVTGKPVGNDLRQRKVSLPVAAGLEHGGEESARLRELLAAAELSDEDVQEATALLDRSGAHEVTAAEAEKQLAAALAELERAPLEPGPREELAELARFVAAREF
jgi:geranylgeranyl diphosphate synthase type I